MNFLDYPLEIKSLNEDGAFSGYGSVFNNVDLHGDIVRPGSFREVVRNDDGRVVFLWQHNTREPIATASVREDAHGLAFTANLIMDDPLARTAYAHLKAKSVRGVSIGFDTIDWRRMQSGGREITSVKLYELSLVTFPANPAAMVTGVKSILDCTDERELKNLLHDRDRLSRSKATAAADAIWRIMKERDEAPDPSENFLLWSSQWLNKFNTKLSKD